MATRQDWEIHQIDVKSAYLNATLRDDIYMRPPPGYLKEKDRGKILKLLRSLYGLKQAGFEWSEELEQFFLDAKFTRSQVDQAVYYRRTSEEHTVITVSVDDMAVMSKHPKHILKFKDQLRTRFEISDLGELTWLLGLKVERDQTARTITLSQEAYINTVLEQFHLEEANPVTMPMETGAVLTKDKDHLTGTQLKISEYSPYQRAIGSLMYAATSTRPDIAFAVSMLSQFMRDPTHAHWEAAKRVMRYLKGMKDLKLTLGAGEEGLQAFVDADWASQPHRHSISGYVVLLHGSPVAWSARKQSLIALSTAEAEYITLTSVAREVLYIQALLDELYEPIKAATIVHCDNQGAIALASNNKYHARTKHIDIRYHFVRALIQNQDLVLQYVPMDENLADAFTKPLPRPCLEILRGKMNISR